MGAELELLKGEEARLMVARTLGFAGMPPWAEMRFEIVRALTWALTSGTVPVHVLRLMNRATAIAQAFERESQDDREIRAMLRECLDGLADAGDIVELSGGLWLPAPSRLVQLGRSNTRLLVGGVPSRLISSAEGGELVHHGPFRRLTREARLSLQLPSEDLESWARIPREPLQRWADALLSVDLANYGEPADGSTLQIYAPGHAKSHAPQYKRWVDEPVGLTGRCLARRTRVFGVREYRLVLIERDRVVQSGAVLAPGEARRLMYALDSRAHNPVTVGVIQTAGRNKITTYSELPRAEQRLFSALGTVAIPPRKPHQRCWTFADDFELALERLRALGIEITTMRARRPGP